MELTDMNRACCNGTHAFTRVELLASLTAVALLINVSATILATAAFRGDRVACLNNLRQIAGGYSQFGSEHDEQTPWRVTASEGGNFDHPLKNNSYIQFSILSNSIASPRILIDPAEDRATARTATQWNHNPQGGLLHPTFGNNAISYFVGLDGNFTTPTTILAGDRHLRHGGVSGCSSGITPAASLGIGPGLVATAAWTNGVHRTSGNIALYDGSVHELDTPGLRRLIRINDDIGGSFTVGHILLPF